MSGIWLLSIWRGCSMLCKKDKSMKGRSSEGDVCISCCLVFAQGKLKKEFTMFIEQILSSSKFTLNQLDNIQGRESDTICLSLPSSITKVIFPTSSSNSVNHRIWSLTLFLIPIPIVNSVSILTFIANPQPASSLPLPSSLFSLILKLILPTFLARTPISRTHKVWARYGLRRTVLWLSMGACLRSHCKHLRSLNSGGCRFWIWDADDRDLWTWMVTAIQHSYIPKLWSLETNSKHQKKQVAHTRTLSFKMLDLNRGYSSSILRTSNLPSNRLYQLLLP